MVKTLASGRRSGSDGLPLHRPEQPQVEQGKQQPAHRELQPHRRMRRREETFQAPGDVGGAAECAKAHEGLPVACFRQIVALLLACQVSEHGCHDRDVPRHPANACIGESFFQERSGML